MTYPPGTWQREEFQRLKSQILSELNKGITDENEAINFYRSFVALLERLKAVSDPMQRTNAQNIRDNVWKIMLEEERHKSALQGMTYTAQRL